MRDSQFLSLPLLTLLHSKATGLLHCLGQLLAHLLLTGVGWQVKSGGLKIDNRYLMMLNVLRSRFG